MNIRNISQEDIHQILRAALRDIKKAEKKDPAGGPDRKGDACYIETIITQKGAG